MRFAGTCSMYSKKAMPQLTSAATYQGWPLRLRRCAYHANVMKILERTSRMTVVTIGGMMRGLHEVFSERVLCLYHFVSKMFVEAARASSQLVGSQPHYIQSARRRPLLGCFDEPASDARSAGRIRDDESENFSTRIGLEHVQRLDVNPADDAASGELSDEQ